MIDRRSFLSDLRLVLGAGLGVCLSVRASAQSRGPGAASAQASSGSDPPAQSAYGQFRSFLSGSRAARGSFRQSVVNASGRVLETTEGQFAFLRPGRFRWEVTKPFEQLMVADGSDLYFFDRDLNQVTVRKLADALAATPAAILFGNEPAQTDYSFAEAGTREGLAWLEAVARQKDSGIERMVIGFRAGLPEALEVVDSFGRTSRFSFGALERNPAIDETLFVFRVPAGADVVRQ